MPHDHRESFRGPPAMSEEEVQQFLVDEERGAQGLTGPSDWRSLSRDHILLAIFYLIAGALNIFVDTSGWPLLVVGVLMIILGIFHSVQAYRADLKVEDGESAEVFEASLDEDPDADLPLSGERLARLRHSYFHGPPTVTEEQVRQLNLETEKVPRTFTPDLGRKTRILENSLTAATFLYLGILILTTGLSWEMLWPVLFAFGFGTYSLVKAYRAFKEPATPQA